MNNWNRMPDALKEQVFSHLDRLAAKAHLSESDRIAYDKAVDRYNVSCIVENDIREQAIAEGLKTGMEKGMAQGMKKGMEKGLAEGVKKGLAEGKRAAALEMKNDDVPFATIAKYTGLTIAEIEQL